MTRKKNYVGITADDIGWTHERFLCSETPTEKTHGSRYNIVMGPFSTKLGALCYVHYGFGNPHTTTVSDCERVAKQHIDDLKGKPDRRHWSKSND